MTHQSKKMALGGAVLVALLIALGYSLMNSGEDKVDSSVANVVETFTCAKCGAKMDLTVEQQTDMLRSRRNIFCAKCGAPGVQKPAIVQLGRGLPESPQTPNAAQPQPLTPGGRPKPTAAGGEGIIRR